jgi:catalase
MMWDFWSLSPESLHQVTILFSDRGTPDGYRHMDGFSSHTVSLINSTNELFYVKATRPLRRDCEGRFPQVASVDSDHAGKEAGTYHINLFDLTEVWPHKGYPLFGVGEVVLDRNPEN